MAIQFSQLNGKLMEAIRGGYTHVVAYSDVNDPYVYIYKSVGPGEDPRAFVHKLKAEGKWFFWGVFWLGADDLRKQMELPGDECYGPECTCGALAYSRVNEQGVPTCISCLYPVPA